MGVVRPLRSLAPTETLDLDAGLSLSPRLKLLLTFYRSDPSVKPIDEWHLKRSLLDFLASSLSIAVPEDDLHIQRCKDLKKRKREDPVASGTLYVRDLSFLKNKEEADSGEDQDKRFLQWRKSIVARLEGIELNLEGVKFNLTVTVPASDDFQLLKESWEEFYTFGSRARYPRGARQLADTLILEGVPSRWFAEPRVSSKPSMLVTHTIFSAFGKIRNLNVAGDDDLGKMDEVGKGGIMTGLQCKIWVQFENHNDFFNAMKVLCSRSMQKQGSRLQADYELSWDKDGYFRSREQAVARNHAQGRTTERQQPARYSRNEPPRIQSEVTRYNSEGAHPKRFRE